MNQTKTAALSGCVIWALSIFMITSCVLPIFVVAGSVSSFSEYAVQMTGGWLCPEGTTPQRYSYSTTTLDDFGARQPATAYELHCVDASGATVKTDPLAYAFVWIGAWVVLGLMASTLLSFLFAAPAGVLLAKALNKIAPVASKNMIDR